MPGIRADIVLPCYRPAAGWHSALLDFHREASPEYDLEYILVNDGSGAGAPGDALKEIAAAGISLKYVSYDVNRGKGYALRAGVAESAAPYILFTDIDFPFTNASVLQVLRVITSGGCNIAVGFRDERYYANKFSLFRKALSKSFRAFIRHGVRLPVTDTQCGLKAFDRRGRELFLETRINRYLFDFEFIYKAVRRGTFVVTPVPVELKKNVVFSRMRTRVILQEIANLAGMMLSRGRR